MLDEEVDDGDLAALAKPARDEDDVPDEDDLDDDDEDDESVLLIEEEDVDAALGVAVVAAGIW